MADNVKISELDALTAAQNSTVVPVVDGGTTKKMSLSTLQTHLTASFATPTQLSTQISAVNSTISGLTTDNISEGSNLYYTTARISEYLGDINAITSSEMVDANQIQNLNSAVLAALGGTDIISGSLTTSSIQDFPVEVSRSAAFYGFGAGGGGGAGDIEGVTAGLGISGGGASGTVTITLDTGSTHFTTGVSASAAAAGFGAGGGGGSTDYISNISLSNSTLTFTAQGSGFSGTIDLANDGADGGNLLTTNDVGNFVTTANYETDSGSFASRLDSVGGGGSVPIGTVSSSVQTIQHLGGSGVVSASAQIVLANADFTGLTSDDIPQGASNEYYTDLSVLSYINSIGVTSGSNGAPGGTVSSSAQTIENLGGSGILSSSNQIEPLGFVTNATYGVGTSSLQSQIDAIEGISANDQNIFLATQFFADSVVVTGSVSINSGSGFFSGSGFGLSNIPASAIVGELSISGSRIIDGNNSLAASSVEGIISTIETGIFFVSGGNLVLSNGNVFSGSGAGLFDIPGSAIVGGVGGGQSIASGSITASIEESGLVINGDISASGDITARSISVGTSGTPTIYSDNNLNLSASNAVVITDSPLRLNPFTNTETGSFTLSNGDIVYNSDSNDFYGYKSGSWASLTVAGEVSWFDITSIPFGLITSSAGFISSSVQIAPNAGTGDILFKDSIGIVTSSTSFTYTQGTETLTAPTMSVGTLSYNTLSGPASATGSFNLVDADRVLINNAVEMPTADGTTNQVIKTNGSGITSFGNVAWGEISSLPSGIVSSSNQLVELDAALEGQANIFTFDQIVSGNLYVTESVLADILTLTAKDPLPTPLNSGSIAVSGSGAQMKPYFWNGIAWQAMI